MSDRTQGSVRPGTRTDVAGDEAAPATSTAGADKPVSATQSIPTGQNRAVQGNGTGGAVPPSAPSGRPAGSASGPAARTTGSATAGTASGRTPAGTSAVGTKATATKTAGKAATQTSAKAPSKSGGRGPRRARLQLRHIDTWSAFKISFVLSIALFFIWMVAVGVLYGVLGGLGVFDSLNQLFGQLGTASGADGDNVVITPGVVFGAAAVIGAVNIILLTALCTVATFIYNLCSDLVGGLELTLSERD